VRGDPKEFLMRRAVLVLAAGTALLAGGLAAPAGAAPSSTGAAASAEHRRIVDYWTPERVRNAVPADVVLDERGRRVEASKPGGGGTTGSTVTGASWTGGGAVLKTTGKVLFTMGTANYVCSGSLVQDGVADRALVLTAGHCVYDDRGDAFATNWMFVPEFDSAPTFTCANTAWGCWTATRLVTTSAWANSEFNHDYAFAVLGAGGKTNAQADDVIGAQPIAFGTVHPTVVHAFGYPAAQPYTGNDLVYCAGTDVKDTVSGSTAYSVGCSMNGGSSGGPWFRSFATSTGTGTLTSLNSFTYRGVKNRMYGPYLGTRAQSAFTAALTATSSTLIA
jgi:V8-like Glu-specific endopeptidase